MSFPRCQFPRPFASANRLGGCLQRLHEERVFIEARDSFYLATVGEAGWPYLQHRGGNAGFLRVISPTQLAFAD